MVSTVVPNATHYLMNATTDLCMLHIEETMPFNSGELFTAFLFIVYCLTINRSPLLC